MKDSLAEFAVLEHGHAAILFADKIADSFVELLELGQLGVAEFTNGSQVGFWNNEDMPFFKRVSIKKYIIVFGFI